LAVMDRRKELNQITDQELEIFRDRFFRDQDAYFAQQIALVRAEERLRARMRYFQPLSQDEKQKHEPQK